MVSLSFSVPLPNRHTRSYTYIYPLHNSTIAAPCALFLARPHRGQARQARSGHFRTGVDGSYAKAAVGPRDIEVLQYGHAPGTPGLQATGRLNSMHGHTATTHCLAHVDRARERMRSAEIERTTVCARVRVRMCMCVQVAKTHRKVHATGKAAELRVRCPVEHLDDAQRLPLTLNNLVHIHTYIQTYKHTYIHTHIHTYIQTYIHTYTHTYIHSYMHTYMHTCMHAYTQTYIMHKHTDHAYFHLCMHTCPFIRGCAIAMYCLQATRIQATYGGGPSVARARSVLDA